MSVPAQRRLLKGRFDVTKATPDIKATPTEYHPAQRNVRTAGKRARSGFQSVPKLRSIRTRIKRRVAASSVKAASGRVVMLEVDGVAHIRTIGDITRHHAGSRPDRVAIHSIDFVDALPRTPTGEIRKRELRKPFWAGQERQVH